MEDRVQSFRERVAEYNRSRPGRRRFTPELRAEALAYVAQRRGEGAYLEVACRELGIPKGTVDRWRRKADDDGGERPRRFVQVQSAPTSVVSFESPTGYRITGLSLAEATELLERFS
jgi:transposase-like protein